tara:strand:- start:27 stop:269 length:243 start_codon:yes stop_codon:yes gene_type:complete
MTKAIIERHLEKIQALAYDCQQYTDSRYYDEAQQQASLAVNAYYSEGVEVYGEIVTTVAVLKHLKKVMQLEDSIPESQFV